MDAWEAVHELRAAGRAGGGRRARVAYLGRERSVPLPRGTSREVAGGSVSLSPVRPFYLEEERPAVSKVGCS